MQTKVLPVIHYESDEQAVRNAQIAVDAGCAGVFLIHMDGDNDVLSPIARDIKARWPQLLVGVNYLGRDTAYALNKNIADGLDMTWTDTQLTHTQSSAVAAVEEASAILALNPSHVLFTGVAFKHQRKEPYPDRAAQRAIQYGLVPTTSGPATGKAAEVSKIAALRQAIGDGPLAIASGITPENVREFAPYLSHVLVATGVSESFYEFDFEKLYQVRVLCDSANAAPL
jgi:predicted TIM-barrel enzyme